MPQISIDGKFYEYSDQQMLLQFALDQGQEIPYFCYHPAMSSPTNCRMCLVDVGFPIKNRDTGEVEKNPDGSVKIAWGRKPITSCNTALAPDMYVRTNRSSEVIDKAQKGVLEFMLINHPLDCPICDQAGECPLQIWTYKYGPEGSRFEVDKVHKPKRVQLGPRVVLDAERCINCTRCERFTDEISKSKQLSMIARGDKNFPATAPGKTFDDPYSMNVVDICPVGALTNSDFRFKARVWEMNYTPSICTSCANGCNVDVWVRDNKVLRQTPLHNPAVNDYWMCDEGRLSYPKWNDNRVSGVKTKGDIPIDFENGLKQVANLLTQHKGRTLFVGSAHASFESLYAFRTLAKGLGAGDVFFVPHLQQGWGDDFLRKDDRTPNRAAAQLLGYQPTTVDALRQLANGGQYGLVYVMEDDAVVGQLGESLGAVPFVVHATQHFFGHDKAAVLLPAATSIEAAGTYINAKGISQMTQQAVQIRRMTPEMWMALPKSRLDAGGVPVDNWRNPENIIDALPSWLLISRIAAELGIDFAYAEHSALFAHLQQQFPDVFGKLTLRRKNRKETFKQSQFDFAINYVLRAPDAVTDPSNEPKQLNQAV